MDWVNVLETVGGYALGTAVGLIVFPILFDWWDHRHEPKETR